MTDVSSDPEVFLTQVNDAIEDINTAIGEFIERSANLVNSHLTELGGLAGGLLGGIPGAIGGALLGRELEQQLEEGVDRINEAWEVASETIRQSIGGLLGDPLRMSSIASRYRDAIQELGQVRRDVVAADTYLSASWTGNAYLAYENTSRFQLETVQGMAATLEDAAQLLDDHQVALLNYWSGQLRNLVDLFTDIVGETAELGDVGNWFTGGAGVVVTLIATAGSSAAAILDDAVQYWVGLNVGRAGDWDSIKSRLGERGFEGDVWPDFTSVDLPNINQPWQPA